MQSVPVQCRAIPAPSPSPARANLIKSPHRASFLPRNPRQMPRLMRAEPSDEDYISYEGDKSVFPVEASEEVGSSAEGFGKEVKPKPSPPTPTKAKTQPDREYIDYKEQKTVFPGEACDELGGEFCEPEYQQGVFPDKVATK